MNFIKVFLFYGPIILFFLNFKSSAQNIAITGKVVDLTSAQPLPYATVLIANSTTKKPITGTVTNDNGAFNVETTEKQFYIEISFIGFKTKTISQFDIVDNTINLGSVSLEEEASTLGEILIQGEVSRTEFKLDKRVFNVGKDISSTGASALEVLNNVPSVNVNIEGVISLRGNSGVQVLINGKPSVLTDGGNALGSITADMIESIEVVTNPSAKYNAEGTSGIINIILKKEELKGINGSLSLNTGIPDNHSVGVSLNRRSEKFNLFTQMGLGRRSILVKELNRTTNITNNTSLNTNGEGYRNEKFYNITLGTDYYLDPTNIFTLSGNYAFEDENQPSIYNYNAFDAQGNLDSSWTRDEDTDATNPKWQYEFNYKKDFKDHKDHDLIFSALGQSFGKDLISLYTNNTISGSNNNAIQKAKSGFSENTYTFKLDYTQPFKEVWNLETGSEFVLNDVANNYEVQNLEDDTYVTNPEFTNNFIYKQNVLGVYATTSYEGKKWGAKAGLRLEHTNLNTILETTNTKNKQEYSNFFPTLHSSYKISETVALQAGYSKRIYRPRLWDLNPFFSIRNNFNIRQGNPHLLPEFTDSYELTSIIDIGKTNLNFGTYYRYTTDVVERITQVNNDVRITKPENIGTNNTIGIEFNTKYTPVKWLTFNVDFNYNNFKRKGRFETQVFDFNGSQWSSKLVSKVKFPAEIDVELTGNYNSKYKSVQSVISDVAFMDLGARKKIMNNKGVVSLSVRDVFASRINESRTTQETFMAYDKSSRGRFIAVGVSYSFGKGEAMEYSGGRTRF